MAKKRTTRSRKTSGSRKSTARESASKTTRTTTRKKKAKSSKSAKPKSSAGLKKTPLSKSELKKFREMLLEKRQSLVGDMTGMEAEAFRSDRGAGRGGSDLSMMPDHPANVASDNYEQEFTLGLLESERIMLAEIDAALERIERGTYGICLGTGKPIGKARLSARPWAKYCIDYARMLEKGLAPAQDENEEGFPLENEENEDEDGDDEGDGED